MGIATSGQRLMPSIKDEAAPESSTYHAPRIRGRETIVSPAPQG
jgi:hypothetical protein